MKTAYLQIALLLWIWPIAKGQSFEIPIYFEDAIGQRDTITVGYDINATYEIDSLFGEADILDSAYTQAFEVRAAIYDYWEWPLLPRIIESKKMIVGYVCFDPTYFDEANSIMVVIKCNNWPVTLSWDKTIFEQACDRIDIVDCTPGGWFDVCGPGHPYQILPMPHVDTASYFSSEFAIETEADTLQALFLRFYKFGSATDNPRPDQPLVFPNPTQGVFQFEYTLSEVDEYTVTDLHGKPIPFSYEDQQIDISGNHNGVYIVSVKLATGQMISQKVVKVYR